MHEGKFHEIRVASMMCTDPSECLLSDGFWRFLGLITLLHTLSLLLPPLLVFLRILSLNHETQKLSIKLADFI
jgi:hypothetical protein